LGLIAFFYLDEEIKKLTRAKIAIVAEEENADVFRKMLDVKPRSNLDFVANGNFEPSKN
jgi:hypothetical protein